MRTGEKRKLFKSGLALFLCFALASTLLIFPAAADNSGNDMKTYAESTETVTILDGASRSEIQAALDKAKDLDDETQLIVEIEAGTYSLEYPLHVYSNTTLKLEDGATMVRDFVGFYGAILDNEAPGGSTDNENYEGYTRSKNIKISGGIWEGNSSTEDENAVEADMFWFCHCEDITIENLTIQNCYGHHIDFAGVKNASVENCRFLNFAGPASSDYNGEAVHLDFISEQHHDYGTEPYDKETSCQDITVNNCEFVNCHGGVGNHHDEEQSSGNYVITNNTFTNMTGACVHLPAVDTALVNVNTAENVRCFAYIQVESLNIEISNNNVDCGEGGNGSTENAHAIWIESSEVVLANNVITNAVQDGIYVQSASSSVKITNNTVSNCGEDGFRITNGTFSLINNYFLDNKQYDIYIQWLASGTMTGNTAGEGKVVIENPDSVSEPEGVDKSALAAAIEEAKGEDENKYTENSWSALTVALANAEDVYVDPDADQNTVNAATAALQEAMNDLVTVATDEEKDALREEIAEAEDLTKGAYTAESVTKLEEAIKAAEAVLDDRNATSDDVEAAIADLQEAMDDLVALATDEEKDALREEIAEAEDLTKGDYTAESVANLEEAIKAAEAVLDDRNATSDDVEAAIADLQEAMDDLVALATDEEKDALREEIAEAEDLTKGDYTAESVANLEEAIKAAETVLEDSNASAADVEAAITDIQKAMDNLIALATDEEKDELSEEITKAEESLTDGNYTTGSVANLEEVIKAAEAVLQDSNASAADVEAAIAALQDAVNALVTAATDEAKEDLSENITKAEETLTEGSYTADSVANLQKAIEAANALLAEGSNASAEDVANAIADIQAAIAALVENTYTGFGSLEGDGNWYYYIDSKIARDMNTVKEGTVKDTNGWWYVVGGQVQLNFTGLAEYGNDYGWWYIENGKVNFDHDCVDQNSYGWWYVVDSKVQFGYTGVANYANEYGWWYIKDGKVDFSCNSVEQNDYGWWYVTGSKVDFSYTGVANYANAHGWWYIKGGKVDFSKTSIEPNQYGWWRVVDGKVDFSCNSVEQNEYGWWYVIGGKVDFSYTGVANYANAYGWWYISGGKVNFSYTGRASNNYGTWYVSGGKVDFNRS